MLSSRTWPAPLEDMSFEVACEFICQDAGLAPGQYAVGKKSKVFIKSHATVERMEEKRKAAFDKIANTISKVGS